MRICKYVGNYLVQYMLKFQLVSFSIKIIMLFLVCPMTFDAPCSLSVQLLEYITLVSTVRYVVCGLLFVSNVGRLNRATRCSHIATL